MTETPAGFRKPTRHITDVGKCARCGHDHADVEFFLFARPPPDASYWAPCPETGDPILMEMTLLENSRSGAA